MILKALSILRSVRLSLLRIVTRFNIRDELYIVAVAMFRAKKIMCTSNDYLLGNCNSSASAGSSDDFLAIRVYPVRNDYAY